ncbi:hypothetical protein L6241_12885 [Janibacter sp. Y6]|uniref:hypothetical protein n=1 Tax=Janibacter sp. Y6 TaxID=2913552 RepID=UPI0034A255E9
MRRRMLIVSLVLVGAMLVALMTPLVVTHAAERTQDLFAERLGDATRFAVVAEDALEEDTFTGLSADLQRYTEVYGGSVVVVNANREVVAGPVPVATTPGCGPRPPRRSTAPEPSPRRPPGPGGRTPSSSAPPSAATRRSSERSSCRHRRRACTRTSRAA